MTSGLHGIVGKVSRRGKTLFFTFICFVLIIYVYIVHTDVPKSYNRADRYSFSDVKAFGRVRQTVPGGSNFTITSMELLQEKLKTNGNVDSLEDILITSDVTGKEFSGVTIRTFPSERVKLRGKTLLKDVKTVPPTHDDGINTCSKWAVITTIFSPPSEAVRRLSYMKNWCVVVVGDKNAPKNYRIASSRSDKRLIFLSDEDQVNMNSEFVDNLPWKSFGRKNAGYLYAIARGADVIWDFDDDNMFKFWIEGATPDINLWIETHTDNLHNQNYSVASVKRKNVDDLKPVCFNPYPFLGAPNSKAWPRGIPLTVISSDEQTRITISNNERKMDIGILQSLADHEPDVDALYRLIHGTPFYFKRDKEQKPTLVLSHRVYTPLNAQATLHFRSAFIAMYLPTTVHGRVSDIWRSYIAQALLSLKGLHVGFLPRPLVDQDRNAHSYLADLQSEIPLYLRAGTVVNFLDVWRQEKIKLGEDKTRSVEDLLEELYIELYERDIVQINDVYSIQRWIAALASIDRLSLGSQAMSVNVNIGQSLFFQPIGTPNECHRQESNSRKLTFWTSDIHDGTRLDYPSIWSHLGHKVVVASSKRMRTPYPEAFKDPNILIPTNISQQILGYQRQTQVNEIMVRNNSEYYKNDELFNHTNAFFCGFYSSMCQLFMPLNATKSILYIPAHRYNLGRCTVESWNYHTQQLIELQQMNTKNPSGPRHIIGGGSRYDYEYLKYYTGLGNSVKLIGSFGGFYTKPGEFKPSEPEILYIDHGLGRFRFNASAIKTSKLVEIHQKYRYYKVEDVLKHRALVYAPYSVMSFKLTDFYSMNIPLFVPSARFYRTHGGLGPDRASTNEPYCPRSLKLTWAVQKHPSSYHGYNPNVNVNEDTESEMYWLQFSDFYDWPYIQYFDDFADLEKKLLNTDFVTVSKLMRQENDIRRYNMLKQWCNIIMQISK